MANQALIQAAQRMYSSGASQTDITPVTSAISEGTSNIKKAVQEKRAEQKKRSKQPFESFKDVVIKDKKAMENFTSELTSLQDQLFKARVKAEGVLVGKKAKTEATNEISSIERKIAAYKEDFDAVDLAYTQPSEYSDFNSLGEVVDNTAVKDVSLSKRLVYDEDGVKAVDHTGKPKRLSEFTALSQVNVDGFRTLVAEREKVIKKAKNKGSWTDASQSLAIELNALMSGDNWGSILFDNVVGQNYSDMPIKEGVGYDWATQEMKARGITDREKFKDIVKKDPDTYKKEFISDTMLAFKNDFDNEISKLEGTGGGISRTPLSESRLAEINIFKNSLKRGIESGKDITFPNGEIGKITSSGNIQLYSKKGEKIEMLPISLDQAMDRAQVPIDMRSDVKPLESKTSTKGGSYSKYKNK
jgi:hypothetical protein